MVDPGFPRRVEPICYLVALNKLCLTDVWRSSWTSIVLRNYVQFIDTFKKVA